MGGCGLVRWSVRGAVWLVAWCFLTGCPGTTPKARAPAHQHIRPPSLSDAPAPTPAKASLPATYEGTIPCDDCPGLRLTLAMWPDGVFYLRATRLQGPNLSAEGASTYEIGRWELTIDGTKLQLFGSQHLPMSFAVKSATRLRKLDADGRELDSGRQWDLVHQKTFSWFEPHVQMDGMYLSEEERGSFTECLTQRVFAIASEAQRRALETHVRQGRTKPKGPVLMTIEGHIVSDADGQAAGRHNIDVQKVVKVWPTETCGRRIVTVRLEDTDWKLVRLRGDPIVPRLDGKEVYVRFQSHGRALLGFTGCNHVRGRYGLEEQRLRIMDVTTTQMACDAGAETEKRLLDGLVSTATWKIRGDTLELYEQDGTGIARFAILQPASEP